jgi:hypothetical protein
MCIAADAGGRRAADEEKNDGASRGRRGASRTRSRTAARTTMREGRVTRRTGRSGGHVVGDAAVVSGSGVVVSCSGRAADGSGGGHLDGPAHTLKQVPGHHLPPLSLSLRRPLLLLPCVSRRWQRRTARLSAAQPGETCSNGRAEGGRQRKTAAKGGDRDEVGEGGRVGTRTGWSG